MLETNNTIVACSTPLGYGAISVIRISGTKAIEIAEKMSRGDFSNKDLLIGEIALKLGFKEKCIFTIFREPKSYTGENTVEIACHGNPLIVEKIIEMSCEFGCEIAEPGDFTKRAYLNGKIGLEQSEAVMQVISSKSELSLIASQKSLNSGLRDQIEPFQRKLRNLRVKIEALIDFSDEDLNLQLNGIREELAEFKRSFTEFYNKTTSFNSLMKGFRVVISGRPNVGKSSLINAISTKKTSIVSEIPGTTRDAVSQEVIINGALFLFIDTAGIRNTDDKIELQGVEIAKKEKGNADLTIILEDSLKNLSNVDLGDNEIQVLNKIDLLEGYESRNIIGVSAKFGTNIEALKNQIFQKCLNSSNEELFSVSNRQNILIKEAGSEINSINEAALDRYIELTAESLKTADLLLGNIYNPISSDGLLGEIFSSFCIGK